MSLPHLTTFGLLLALAWPGQARADEAIDWPTRVRNLFHDADVSAGAVAILRGGELVHAIHVGDAQHGEDAPLDDDSVHLAASLSKPVFAHLVLQCVDEGLLDLDTPLIELMPQPRLAGVAGAERITARMLLSHSAGLPNWSGGDLELLFEPGRGWSDSGEGYLWLQQVLEHVTGAPLDALIRTRVLRPLGMEHSGFVWDESMGDRLVSGRNAFGQPRRVGRIATPNAAGTLLTTLEDMARFVSASLAGTLLSRELAEQAFLPQVAVGAPYQDDCPVSLSWGLGWGLADDGERQAFWQWGDAGEFTAWVLAWRDTGDALVLLANDSAGLSVAGTLGRWLRDVPQVAPEHLGYEPWDGADRALRRRLLTSFRRSVAAGTRKWEELADAFAPDERLDHLRQAGFTLLFEGRAQEALALLEIAALAHANDPVAHEALAEAASHVGDWDRATRAFEAALALAHDPVRARRLEWVRAERDAPANPAPLDPIFAGRLVGRYGEHVISPLGAGLGWSRTGVAPRALRPLGDGVFGVEGLGLHLRFVLEGPGPAGAMRAESGSGRVDVFRRAP